MQLTRSHTHCLFNHKIIFKNELEIDTAFDRCACRQQKKLKSNHYFDLGSKKEYDQSHGIRRVDEIENSDLSEQTRDSVTLDKNGKQHEW